MIAQSEVRFNKRFRLRGTVGIGAVRDAKQTSRTPGDAPNAEGVSKVQSLPVHEVGSGTDKTHILLPLDVDHAAVPPEVLPLQYIAGRAEDKYARAASG